MTAPAEAPATINIDLPGTKSYARRGLYWSPAPTGFVADPFDAGHRPAGVGCLVIARAKDFAKRSPEVETTFYAVEPVDTGRPDVVSYLLLKFAPEGGETPTYCVTGGATGRKCTCAAGNTGKPCVHLDAIAAVIAARALPGPKCHKPR